MKLLIGLLFLVTGGVLALFGYAPLGSTFASSLALIAIGGVLVAVGIVILLLVSARSLDPSDIDRDTLIRG